jgi:hypothetical protein
MVHDADALLIVDDGVGGDGEEEDVTVTPLQVTGSQWNLLSICCQLGVFDFNLPGQFA